MSKTIKVEDKVYLELEHFRSKGETFSEAVQELLTVRNNICELVNILEGMIRYREWKLEKLEREATLGGRGDRSTLP